MVRPYFPYYFQHFLPGHLLRLLYSEWNLRSRPGLYHWVSTDLISWTPVADKETVLMLPEIHVSETGIRQKLNLSGKSNPDLLVGNVFVDVKSPFAIEEISQNACRAYQQGAIACITDDHCVIKEDQLPKYADWVLRSQGYHFDEVHFVVNGVLYKYNSQGRILG